MRPGKEIVVEGKIPPKSDGFDITIQTGYERPIEAQLRISAKFSDKGNVILLKHFGERVWNLDDHFHGLLETKTTFTVVITCLSKEYTVKIKMSAFYQRITHTYFDTIAQEFVRGL